MCRLPTTVDQPYGSADALVPAGHDGQESTDSQAPNTPIHGNCDMDDVYNRLRTPD